MKTLVIDNYDSFTYNLFQYLAEIGGDPLVVKNDEIELSDIQEIKPTHIVISPGPGTPKNREDFGIGTEIIKNLHRWYPILGVCLGHQGIAATYGANIIHAPEVMHGKTSIITHTGDSLLFKNIPKQIPVMRYHSLLVDEHTLPSTFKVTARTAHDHLCMALEHTTYPLFGVQFHPESIGTPHGKQILRNFLAIDPPIKSKR